MSVPVPTRPVSIVSDEAEALALDAAWRDYLPLQKTARAAALKHEQLSLLLPQWARPGPSHVKHDGSHTGQVSGYPEMPDVGLPQNPGTVRIIRPSLRETWDQHTWVHKQFGYGDPKAVYRKGIAAVRRWYARKRELKALQDDLGITAAEIEWDLCEDATGPCYVRIDELSEGSSHAAIASNLLMSAYAALRPGNGKLTTQSTIRNQLRFIVPRLDGIVAKLALDFIQVEGRADSDFLIWTGMDEHEIEEAAPSHLAAQRDPLLALIRDYQAGMAAYDAATDNSAEQDAALKDASWGPLYDRLMEAPPMPTTAEGALAAVRLALEEERDCGSQPDLTIALLEAAMSYFDPAEVAAEPEAVAA